MTVGEILRSEREKKGLSIKDVETATSIRALYINAIEDDNYKVVPGEVYLKGFIRNYANYLGLQGQEMVDLYRQNQSLTQPAIANSVEELQTQSNKPSLSIMKWLVAGILLICVAGGIWWMAANNKPSEFTPVKESNLPPSTPAQPFPQTVTDSPAIPSPDKPVVITAKYTSECWTLVTADGKEIYEGIPRNGDTITWTAQKNITIKAGNAGGIDIVYNGQAAGKLGDKGEVVVKTFSAK
jgi:cytoskeletal protein RodZ